MRLLLVLTFVAQFAVVAVKAEEPILFGRDIRPLLSDRCFTCHGPDRAGQENELRLDIHDAAHQTAIVAGNANASELIARITSSDPDVQMPPPESGKRAFTPSEIDLLKRWVDSGAEYTDHWSYIPPVRPELPPVKQGDWPLNPIDHFILARMEQDGIAPQPVADRRTLIRRLYFDLLGLPPTPAQVAAFSSNYSPTAYADLVDQLLADERFGERMAMYWLDLVRYADTAGYHSDNARSVDAFRDYVIDAFNENKPFDTFTTEQLAGDLLPDATVAQKVASGYNRLLQTTEEGGAQPKEYVAIYQADRVRNVADVWLASTMGCCQCHDHKYDPFSTRDFYALGAFFADLRETPVGRQQPNLKLPTPEQSNEMAMLAEQLAAVRNQPVEPSALTAWATEQQAALIAARAAWQIITPSSATSAGGQQLTPQPDGSLLASGSNPAQDVYTITLPLNGDAKTGLRLEALTHDSLSKKSLSRANGNFVLTKIEVLRIAADGTSQPVVLASAVADYEQPDWPVTGLLDDNPSTGWAGNGHVQGANRTAVFKFREPVSAAEGAALQVILKHESVHNQHNIGRPRLSLTSQAEPAVLSGLQLPADLATVLEHPAENWTDAQRVVLLKHYRELAPALASARADIDAFTKRLAAIEGSLRTMLIAESIPPREVRVLPRGNWLDDSGEVVQPQVPASLGKIDVTDRRPTRLDLAQWIVNPNNPLTARVFVNRLWRLLYGHGLARSLEDVGHQGEWPTHPELLDWLAVEFMDSGWDVKHMLRLMASTRTYQLSSVVSMDARSRDPFNRYFARQTRFRLDAEMIRDNALAVSGLLVSDQKGPSVKPYQPAGYWQHLNFPQREWESDHGSSQYRRGLYTFWCRSFLHPSLLAFDATSREECVATRPRSNTPVQALVLLNDPTYVEAARVLGSRIAAHPGSDTERLTFAWQQVLQRDPDGDEQSTLQNILQATRSELQAAPQLAEEFQRNGDATVTEVSATANTEWGAVARVLLNLHETIIRE